jgi:hypothetical protein
MSYVVQIWEQAPGYAWPRNVDDAVAWLDWLQDFSPGQNPKFIEFARRLTARYPDLSSPEARLLPVEEQAWSDGPMNGETDAMVYGIGIATGNKFEEVHPFVLATARALGLCVADEQAGQYHFPNGLVLGLRGTPRHVRDEARLGPASADLLPKEALIELICLRLAPLLKRRGYTPLFPPAASTPAAGEPAAPGERPPGPPYIERRFRAEHPTGWHTLEITVYDRRPGYMAFQLDAGSCCRAVSGLQRRADAALAPDAPLPAHVPDTAAGDADTHDPDPGDITTTFLRQYQWMTDTAGLTGTDEVLYILLSMADLAPAVAHLSEQLETRLLPLLRCYDSIAALDAACNGTFEAPSLKASVFFAGYYRFALHHLRIAYLAGNPHLEAMCAKYEEMLGKEGRSVFAGADEAVRDCVAYLRAHSRTPPRAPSTGAPRA